MPASCRPQAKAIALSRKTSEGRWPMANDCSCNLASPPAALKPVREHTAGSGREVWAPRADSHD